MAIFHQRSYILNWGRGPNSKSNRILYCDLNADGIIDTPGEIIEEKHYYPFGMAMEGPWMSSASMDYGYNGIEYEDHLGLDMNLASYRGLDPALGRWCQLDPKAEATRSLTPYGSMNNNPISNVDPGGDIAWLAIGIAAALHTGTHLATNNFTFNNWNWGAFAGSVVAGAVGGYIGPALEKAQIGGFYGGAILGGSSAFSHNFTSGVINNNLSFKGLASSTLIGASAGGLMSGIEAESRGYRFSDGRSRVVTERYQLASGNTPTTENSNNQISGENPMSLGDAIKNGDVGPYRGKIIESKSASVNTGFEGDLQVRGNAYLAEGQDFYINVDGKDVLNMTKGGRINMQISSKSNKITWGIKGDALQQSTIQHGVKISLTVRPNSYIYITGKHRGWDGFLFWGR